MALSRFIKFVGVMACIIGGIFFIMPGDFIFTQLTMSYVTKYGSLVLPGLGSNPNLAFYVEKSPTIILVIIGLFCILVGIGMDVKDSV